MTSNPIAEHKKPMNPSTVQLLLIDVQPETIPNCKTNSREGLVKAIRGMARIANMLDLPVTASLVRTGSRDPKVLPELEGSFQNIQVFARTTINVFDDAATRQRIEGLGRHDVVVFGAVSEIAVLLASFTAVALGHEVHVPVDACAGYSQRTEDAAFRRIESFGAATAAAGTLAAVLQPNLAGSHGPETAEILSQIMT
jgi:nicotinamidase-related amidase